MREVVIVDAVRSPVGKRNGGLASMHSNELLGGVLAGLLARSGLTGAEVDHVVGGCVVQLGMQAANVTRNAWLTAGLPPEVPAVTVNAQCGSSQEAHLIAQAMIAGGLADVAIACGVEVMSRVPLGSNMPPGGPYGDPRGGRYAEVHEPTIQFEAADRIAERWRLGREALDAFAKTSQDRAALAWERDRFGGQIVPVDAPVVGADGEIVGTKTITRDEGLRPTTLDGLAGLRLNQPDRVPPSLHTAGNSSQISDGASAVLLMSREKADLLGLRPRARVVDSVLVGSDPVLMLTGPIPATARILARTGLALSDIDVVEINEAFASVVCAWAKEHGADLDRVNVNGGAIALGHPLGATGTILITKAVHELERAGGRYALITMCCGGGLGTGTVLERLSEDHPRDVLDGAER
ncbi:acetyl-CoA C-acyltransferase [Actinomadura chibensis]|uniref:Acetyl-CoA C-acyltransferase n=1 Tax=Actinomadura chibensis TaxID=392828 RepID=A0A5D0NVJ1_9ACTN|nr:acetyl-CoA C-acyltransferase [Actinomadura chibensis]TYB48219.1 acetyl-CoA C-acyltransferase [Actinomadura chibensis]